MGEHTSQYFVGWLFGWFVLALVVAVIAASRDRNPIAWLFIALLTSPLLAFIILMVTPNLATNSATHAESPAAEQPAQKDSGRIQGADIALRLEQLRQLREKQVVTQTEYAARKQKIFNELHGKKLVETPEEFLTLLVPLADAGAITAEELARAKTFAFDEARTQAPRREESAIDAPATRACPKCGGLINPKATTCMHCWAKVASV